MTITLAASATLQGSAGSSTSITATVFGDEIDTVTLLDTFKKLYQGQLSAVAGVLYTVGAGKQTVVKTITLANTTAGDVVATLFVDGTADTNRVVRVTVPANGSATYASDGWRVLDATGAALSTSNVTLTGDVTGSGAGSVATTITADAVTTLKIINDAVTNAKLANMPAHTFKGNNTAGSTDPLDLSIAQLQAELGISGTNTGDQNIFQTVTGNTGSAVADTTADTIAITGANGVTTAATSTPDGLVITGANAFGVVTGTTGTATADTSGDSLAITGANGISTAATDTPDGLVITGANAFGVVTGNSGTATSDTSGDSIAITGTGQASTTATDTPDGLVVAVPLLSGDVTSVAGGATTLPVVNANVGTFGDATHVPTVTVNAKGQVTAASHTLFSAGGNAFGVVTGNSGTANSDTTGDTIAITGTGSVSTAATDTPDGLVITNAAATFTAAGNLTATEKIELNSIDGRTNAGATPRVFRPGDYMVGNTFDPTGGSNSTTAFSAMMTALRAHNDRCMIQLSPGVFKLDHDILKDFGTNNTSVPIRGPGRGTCILLPNAAPTGTQSMITFNRNTTGGDAIAVSGFTIYNTSGTVYTAGNGILTNGADAIDITEVAFIDLFNDIHVSGQPYTMVTNGTTAVSGIVPNVSAADNGQVVSGPGIVAGTTFTFATATTGTLSVAATSSATATRFLNNTIKCSIQKMVSFNTNSNGNSVGIVVNNGQAGDTYMGPDIVMSDGGGTTRRRACIDLIESGHYEITQANLTGSQRGILIDPGASQSVAFGFHTNVLCDSNSINGMRVDSTTASSVIKNIKSVNSWYSGTVVINGSAAAAGVLTTGVGAINGITFTTDRFLNNRTHGFEHGKGTDFRWSDCDMKGNSSAGSGISDGLNVASNIGNFSINGGKFGGTDTVPTGGNQRYGILVAGGSGDNIKISPDDLTGNVVGPLSMSALGANVFINGCPGLAANYSRGVTSGSILTVTTLGNILIPKNSTRVTSSYRLTARGKASGATTVPVFSVRIGGTNDTVGTAATNPIIAIASDATLTSGGWTTVEFIVTVTLLGPAANSTIQAAGFGTSTTAATTARAFGSGIAAIGAGAGQLTTVNLATDQYLTLAFVGATAGVVFYTTNIEVMNY